MVENQQLTAAQLNMQGTEDSAQAPGPRIKTPPDPFKIKPKSNGTGFTIEGPTFKIEFGNLPGKPTLEWIPQMWITPFPPRGKPYVDPGITIGFSIKF